MNFGDAVMTPLPADPYANDPFFKRHTNTTWNACIGEQGEEENYLDGYMEAARELADSIIDKKMLEKRDTLVLPILYNARHAVELVLKFVTTRLVNAGLMTESRRTDHNIGKYLEELRQAAVGDEQLDKQVRALEPYVSSLARIDKDGQELRYHLNRFDDPSLSDYSLANLEVIRASLSELSEIITILKNRVICFTHECESGLFTKRCSRRDLLAIAQIIPRRDSWNSALFDQQKAKVKARFNLTNRQFSDALDVIQASRETKALIGIETDLLHLSDDEIVWLVKQWRLVHPVRDERGHVFVLKFDEALLENMKKEMAARNDVILGIEQQLTEDKLAEIDAIFYLGRDRIFSENYEKLVERKKLELALNSSTSARIAHLIDKTNFLDAVRMAAKRIGRLSLATRLETV